MSEPYFITGAQGCIGSWVVKAIAEHGHKPIVFDRSADAHRLAAIMRPELLAEVSFVVGDITDKRAVVEALEASKASRVIHLAGLQVPTCKADPVAGAQVNVIGTLNVFEAVRALNISGLVYASSAAVYGMNDENLPIDETTQCKPTTHYGVFKQANEGNARIYLLDHGISSAGLRPLTVYGVNRDTGFTSDPTKAMKAAVLSRRFHIRFGGSTDFQYVADTAAAFIACADDLPTGANVFNLHGDTVEVAEIVRLINELAGDDLVTFSGPPIPIPPTMSDASIRRSLGELPATSLRNGVQQTMDLFKSLRDAGRLETGDLEI